MPIKLSLRKDFGPFTDVGNVELPDLAVLTGLNGSGETHLRKAIQARRVEVSIDGTVVPANRILPQLTGKVT